MLLNLLLKLFVDLFATQFSLFKFNGWKKVQEDPALLQVYQETHQSLAAVVAQKESELKQAMASETA